ncbi:DODA-type extradiol aromatic ring-opening family dioxygenase [Vibrio astriarenae]|uniref:DODA-type extradiol aromatic ring-opening family dioxygenase n=1 Tax=Vibrio astriarenae TaxID=1481923 RepID=UPI003736FE01
MSHSIYPALFISHGSPMLVVEQTKTTRFFEHLGATLPKPKAIVIFSAHMDSRHEVIITAAEHPHTVHDFYGFPEPLYQLNYPAPGDPDLAQTIASKISEAGFPVFLDPKRGWDHGVWMPLMLVYPNANIPIVQVSIDANAGTEYNHRLGNALRSLREEEVLMIGSGGISHNLQAYFSPDSLPENEVKVQAFTDWVNRHLEGGDRNSLLDYQSLAPEADFNHPTQEHFLPLLTILGTSDGKEIRRIHSDLDNRVLALDAYQFS